MPSVILWPVTPTADPPAGAAGSEAGSGKREGWSACAFEVAPAPDGSSLLHAPARTEGSWGRTSGATFPVLVSITNDPLFDALGDVVALGRVDPP